MQRTRDQASTDDILRKLVEELARGDYRSDDGSPLKRTAAYRDAVAFVYLSDLAAMDRDRNAGYPS